jgi:hypothetical protein
MFFFFIADENTYYMKKKPLDIDFLIHQEKYKFMNGTKFQIS